MKAARHVAAVCLALLCSWLLVSKGLPAEGATRFPDYRTLTTGPHQLHLLPGMESFVFSLYGAPGDLATVRSLVDMLRESKLANGFDPGPSPNPQSQPVFAYLVEFISASILAKPKVGDGWAKLAGSRHWIGKQRITRRQFVQTAKTEAE